MSHLARTRTLRISKCAAAAVVLAALAGAPAPAAVLPSSGTLAVQIATIQPVTLTGSGIGTIAGGPGSLHTLPAGFFANATQIVAPISPTFTGVDFITVPAGVQNPAGAFAPNGAMGLVGSAFFYTPGNALAGQVPLAPIGGGGNAPLAIGPVGGTLLGVTWMGAGAGSPIVFTGMSAALCIPLSATATAYDNRTAGGLGALQLVAPAKASLGIFGFIPVFGVLTINATPEPGTLLLLGVGVAGLAARGSWLRRARVAERARS